MPLTQAELLILKAVRELKPFEVVQIIKDKDGSPDKFFIKRQEQVLLEQEKIIPVNTRVD